MLKCLSIQFRFESIKKTKFIRAKKKINDFVFNSKLLLLTLVYKYWLKINQKQITSYNLYNQ